MEISRNLCFHGGPQECLDACRLETTASHGRVKVLILRLAAHALPSLEHLVPFFHGKRALALSKEQLVARREAQDVQRVGRFGVSGRRFDSNAAVIAGRNR